jgi:hypothetical protein
LLSPLCCGQCRRPAAALQARSGALRAAEHMAGQHSGLEAPERLSAADYGPRLGEVVLRGRGTRSATTRCTL